MWLSAQRAVRELGTAGPVDALKLSNPGHGRDKLLFHGTSEFGYDANGRRRWSRRLAGTSYFIQCLGYDVFGALITVQTRTTSVGTESDPCDHAGPWTEVVYGVDVTGRRVTRDDGTTQTAWLYQDALNPVAQLDGLGRLQQVYVYATRGHVPDAIQVFNPVTGDQTATWAVISDLRGSVRAVVDVATGTVVQRLSYDAWGVVTYDSAPGTQPFGYAGGLYDHATELVRYGARDYDPLVGRWTAPDPIGFGGGDTNLYAYVDGDPVNWIDVNGLHPGSWMWNGGGGGGAGSVSAANGARGFGGGGGGFLGVAGGTAFAGAFVADAGCQTATRGRHNWDAVQSLRSGAVSAAVAIGIGTAYVAHAILITETGVVATTLSSMTSGLLNRGALLTTDIIFGFTASLLTDIALGAEPTATDVRNTAGTAVAGGFALTGLGMFAAQILR